jgi:hypothetical protein
VTRLDLARCAHQRGSGAEVDAELEAARAALLGVAAPGWLERLDDVAHDLGSTIRAAAPE